MKTNKNGIKGQYRQGDVLLENASVPQNAKKLDRENGRVILANGEVTGHAHAIEADGCALLEAEGERYLQTETEVPLQHEEHGAININTTKRVRRQSEYDPMEIRRVTD
jgi:hypothetical protein